MFEAAELGRSLSHDEYEARVPALRAQLLEAQFELRSGGPPVLVVISGADGAGKGDTVNRLHEWLDPRGVETHAFGPPSDEERERPPYWRFWRTLPARGRIGIFFGSWYTDPIIQRVYGETSKAELEQALARIAEFERLLSADGAVIVKLWFHLSRKAQGARLRRLERDETTRWRVSATDWKHFRRYDRFRRVSEQALAATDTAHAPWTIVEATDDRHRDVTVGEHVLHALQARPARPPLPVEPVEPVAAVVTAERKEGPAAAPTLLGSVDLSERMGRRRAENRLLKLQGRLNTLVLEARKQGRSSVLVFEGWDAAGKGGAIRRVAEAMDARWYQVVPIAAPTDEERAHHYLWRFWRHVPRAGRVTIFDRSWYGRVLVERVEGFARVDEWRRAYEEIAEFERQLVEAGVIVAKFWIHIDPDEQLRRFEARGQTAWKRHKITDEDWRNRSRWDDYATAVEEMVARTGTTDAPWNLIAGNDKRVARVQVLEAVVKRLRQALA